MNLLSSITAFFQPKKPTTKPDCEPESEGEIYKKRMQSLGPWRWRVLLCTLSHWRAGSPLYFDPPQDADLHQECLLHFERLYEMEEARSNPPKPNVDMATVAAGLLTFGRLEMAEVVLENMLPEFWTDHYCGWCNVLPMVIFDRLLPMSKGICRSSLAGGRIDIEAARDWLHANQSLLQWDREQERFVLLEKASD
jgi:hypothetical protein